METVKKSFLLLSILITVTIVSCSKTEQSITSTDPSYNAETKSSFEIPLPRINSDRMLFTYLNSQEPFMVKLTPEAKDQLMETSRFEFRGFDKTGELRKVLNENDLNTFFNYAVTMTSSRQLSQDFQNQGHPLYPIFKKIPEATRVLLVDNCVFQFHGFDNESLMRRILSCDDYQLFYNYILGEQVRIVYEIGCPCEFQNVTIIPMPDSQENPPCQTQVVWDYKYKSGSTWTIADCERLTDATCLICKKGNDQGGN